MGVLCSICNNDQTFFRIKYNSKNKLFSNINIYSCKICNSSYAYPIPTEVALKKYYQNQAETSIGPDQAGFINKSFAYMLAKTRLRYIEDKLLINDLSKFNILEIGPGYGHLAEIIKKKYFVHDYSVVEFDKNCFNKLHSIGTNVYENLNSINNKKKFNLIIISHVLEHMPDPVSFLLTLKNNYLKHNSIIFIDIPCDDWLYKVNIDPHLIFFNKSSLKYISNHIKMNIIRVDYIGEKINNINDNEDNFYLRQYKKIILLIYIIFNLFKKKDNNYSLVEYTLKKIFKADQVINEKARWIRLILQK